MIGEINDPDLLQRRPPWQRAIVISGGVIANILLTFILSASTSYFSGIGMIFSLRFHSLNYAYYYHLI